MLGTRDAACSFMARPGVGPSLGRALNCRQVSQIRGCPWHSPGAVHKASVFCVLCPGMRFICLPRATCAHCPAGSCVSSDAANVSFSPASLVAFTKNAALSLLRNVLPRSNSLFLFLYFFLCGRCLLIGLLSIFDKISRRHWVAAAAAGSLCLRIYSSLVILAAPQKHYLNR